MFSFWEKQSFTTYDHIIIGAGIVGMSVAIELRKKFPKERILILERGFMPTGASSRNAGFACMGSVTELLADLKKMSEDEVIGLFAARKRGLEILKKRLGEDKIGYQNKGSYELIGEQNIEATQQIDYLNNLLFSVNKQDTFKLSNHLINSFGFAQEHTKSLIQNLCEGELNTGAMLRALSDYCLQQNIEIKTGASVSSFEEEDNHISVFAPDTLRKEEWQLNSKHLYICTNAFTKQLLPNEDVTPGRGQVFITKPISNLAFKGIFHFDEGYYYFRAFQNRVLLGGGRNLDFEQETSCELELNIMIQSKLDDLLRQVILPNTDFEIEQRWSGIMAFGKSKNPIVKSFSNRVHGAFRMGGMGVAMGSEVAERLVASLFH
jgi:gamma-glutamylputrescine oxidase